MSARIIPIIAAAGLVLGSTAVTFAQSSTSHKTPGHMMQRYGSKPGQPGASGYSPGHQMQRLGSRRGHPGASGYAPGHKNDSLSTTGQGTRR